MTTFLRIICGCILLIAFRLFAATAQDRWSTWSPLARPNVKNANDAGPSYRTKYEMQAVAAPSHSLCLVQIRDDQRRGRISTVLLRVVYIVTDNNGKASGQMLEPTVELTNATDSVVLRHSNCVSVGSVELISVNRH